MLVKCITNDIRSVPEASDLGRELKHSFGAGTHQLHLTIGALYVVYGIEINRSLIRYYVADDLYSRLLYPVSYFDAFFEIVDRRLSRCWTIGTGIDNVRSSDLLLTFEEWATDTAFYERLVDGSALELRTFQIRKEFMDLEFKEN